MNEKIFDMAKIAATALSDKKGQEDRKSVGRERV